MAAKKARRRPLITVPTRLPASRASAAREGWVAGTAAVGVAGALAPAVVVPSPAATGPDGGAAPADVAGVAPAAVASADVGAAPAPAASVVAEPVGVGPPRPAAAAVFGAVAAAVSEPVSVAAVAPSSSRVARRQLANWPKRRVATSLMAPPRPKEATLPVSWTSLVPRWRVRVSLVPSRRVSTLALAVPAPLVSLPLAVRRALWEASSISSTVTLPL